jgi:hypothetical protein
MCSFRQITNNKLLKRLEEFKHVILEFQLRRLVRLNVSSLGSCMYSVRVVRLPEREMSLLLTNFIFKLNLLNGLPVERCLVRCSAGQ